MSQDMTPDAATLTLTQSSTYTDTVTATVSDTVARHRRDVLFSDSTRIFEGATPKVGGVSGLRSENVKKKLRITLS